MTKIKKSLSDYKIMTGRSVTQIFRNLDSLILTFLIPVILLLIFNFLFSGAIDLGNTDIKFIDYVTVGIIILVIAQSAMAIAPVVHHDYSSGILNRFKTMPVSKSAFLVGHTIAGVIRNVISIAAIFIVALLIGYRPQAITTFQWIIIIIIPLSFAFTISMLSVFWGLFTKSTEGAGSLGMVLQVLGFMSSIFVPISAMASSIQGFATHQPINVMVEVMRYASLGIDGGNVLAAFLWNIGLFILFLFLAILVYNKKKS